MVTKTLKISVETHKKLLQASRKSQTFDDKIKELLDKEVQNELDEK